MESESAMHFKQTAFTCCLLLWISISLIVPPHSGSQIISPVPDPVISKKKLLVLHSYYKGFEWTDLIDQGIGDALTGHGHDVSVFTEYMDLKRFPEDPHIESLRRVFRIKYSKTRFDAILASDDHAFQFLLQFRDELFPGAPVIFCGVNDFDPAMLKGHSGFTGVVEKIDIRGTLDIALRLHPDTRTVAVIVDTTPTGVGTLKELRNVAPAFSSRVRFDIHDDVKMSDLLQTAGRFRPDTLILLLNFNRDSTGNNFSHWETIELLQGVSQAPIYSFWDFFTGKGIVGGVITSGIDQGRIAGHQALRVLQGDPVADIPIEPAPPRRILFDYKQMKRFGIRQADLPADSVVINLPGTFYRINKKLIWTLGGLLIFLSITTIVLILSILQRKRAQKALSEAEKELLLSNEKLSMILDSLPIIPFTCDPSNQTVTYVSPVIERITGYPTLSFMEKPGFWSDRVHPGDRERLLAALSQFDAEGRQHHKYRFCCADGSYRWFYDIRHLVEHADQNVSMIVGTWQDVTKEQILQEEADLRLQQLIQADKLASLGEVVAGVAHEINNPNSFISYNIPLLRESWDFFRSVIRDYCRRNPQWRLNGVPGEELCREMDEILGDISASSQRINQVVADLKDFAKIDADSDGRLIQINEVVKKALNIVGAQIRKSFVEYTIHLAPDLPPIQGHFTKLEQVVTNLVVNASQAVSAGKRSVFSLRTERVESLRCVAIHVQDSGAGVSPDIGDRIFDPFFTTRSRQGGTGLGLSVSRRLVEEHHGSLLFVSRPGAGTRFSVFLPLTGDDRLDVRPALLWFGQKEEPLRGPAVDARLSRNFLPVIAVDTEQEAWDALNGHPEVKAVVGSMPVLGGSALDFLAKVAGHDPLLQRAVYGDQGALTEGGGVPGVIDAWLLPPLETALTDSFFRKDGAYEDSDRGRRTARPEVTQTPAASAGH
jgi:PAS domain S-box-containing protein